MVVPQQGGLFPDVLGGEWGNERERERGTGRQPKAATPSPTNAQLTKKTVSTKGWVFFTRFGHGGTLGEDN